MHIAGWTTPMMIKRYLNTEGLRAADETRNLLDDINKRKKSNNDDNESANNLVLY